MGRWCREDRRVGGVGVGRGGSAHTHEARHGASIRRCVRVRGFLDVRHLRAAIVGVALPSGACASPAERDTTGQDLPKENDIRVELFAPGLVSSTLPPFEGIEAIDPFVSPDGAHLYISADSGVGEDEPSSFDLWRISREGGDPTPEPTRPPAPINNEFTDFAPSFFDGDLYFTSERPGVAETPAEGARPPGDIYRTPVPPLRRLC